MEANMPNLATPPPVRKERKIPVLQLFFPVTKRIGTIAIYKFDDAGMHLMRVLHGCNVEG